MTIFTIFFSREKHKNLSFRVRVPYHKSENLVVKNERSHRRLVPRVEQSTSSEFGSKRRSFGRPNGRSKFRREPQNSTAAAPFFSPCSALFKNSSFSLLFIFLTTKASYHQLISKPNPFHIFFSFTTHYLKRPIFKAQ